MVPPEVTSAMVEHEAGREATNEVNCGRSVSKYDGRGSVWKKVSAVTLVIVCNRYVGWFVDPRVQQMEINSGIVAQSNLREGVFLPEADAGG
jgi:hypothetical protein